MTITFLPFSTYNLTAAVYAETENVKYSSVVAVIKASSSYERFENLRNSKACFAEFGGIGNAFASKVKKPTNFQ